MEKRNEKLNCGECEGKSFCVYVCLAFSATIIYVRFSLDCMNEKIR